jgi:CheY-like chemotaxis protein
VLTRNNDEELFFQVCDTGAGIAADKQQEIFQPFHQVGRVAGGTGLGLPISQRLCEAMGGALSVQSAIGAGSCFSFHLPLKRSTAARAPNSLRAPQQRIDTGNHSVKIMVVDDNPVNRQVVASMLRSSGVELIEAENGEEALDKLREHATAVPVALVLMDVRMPVMDGFAATRAIKSDPVLRNTVVLALSASVFPDVVDGMRAHGCEDFISKPVRADDLLTKIAGYLHLPLRNIDMARPDISPQLAAAIPPALLHELRSAVAVGDLEAMRAALATFRELGPEFTGLAGHIGQLLDNFEIEAIRDLLAPSCATA